MPNYPTAPFPPDLTPAQYDLLWQVVQQGKILLVDHGAAQGPRIQGLLQMGYLAATPLLRTPAARDRCQDHLEDCYDQLAAIPRDAWPVRFEEAERLVAAARWHRRQLIESEYHVTEAGYHLVRAWENGGRDGALLQQADSRVTAPTTR